MGKFFALIFGLVLVLFGYYTGFISTAVNATQEVNDPVSNLEDDMDLGTVGDIFDPVEYFGVALRDKAIEMTNAIPIEGYTADMYLGLFPNMSANDFIGVEAIGGRYEINDGLLEYVKEDSDVATSADGTVSVKGLETLLVNISSRTGRVANTAESIDSLIDFLTDNNFSNTEPIVLDNLKEGDQISSPLVITGEAPFLWFFEGDFPVIVYDYDENKVYSTSALIQISNEEYSRIIESGDTDISVPFKTELDFIPPLTSQGYIVFSRDNPKGDSEIEFVAIPVFFE